MYVMKSPKRITVKGYVKDDCTIIAIGNALGISYDLARKVLQVGVYFDNKFAFAKQGPRTKPQFTDLFHVKRISRALSTEETEFYGQKLTLNEVSKILGMGTYIVLVKGHLTTVIDGEIIDTWDSSNSIVSVAYKVNPKKAKETIYDLAEFYRMSSDEHLMSDVMINR